MSPWTKRLQRSTRSFAPFSGVLLHCALASLIQIIGAAADAATAADVFRNSRRSNLLIVLLLMVGVVLSSRECARARNQATRQRPLAASNRCARRRSGARLILSPARQSVLSSIVAVTSWPLNRQ